MVYMTQMAEGTIVSIDTPFKPFLKERCLQPIDNMLIFMGNKQLSAGVPASKFVMPE